MKQGAVSQPGVTTRSRSGAVPPGPRCTLPQGLPKPKAKDSEKNKGTGVHPLGPTQTKQLKNNLMRRWAGFPSDQKPLGKRYYHK
ncbi:hypothetical protein LIER_25079 [Lithospermum erythrorhizon]|uniref:Uncharacterized protein n=1 Tax=Lithospermum erythrorhizon TaxID=34254 RepID=A0AAV3R3F5_LITER